jgi:hypothetical protein
MNDAELKIQKKLASLRDSMLNTIYHRAVNLLQYSKDKPDEFVNFVESIAMPEKWDYNGILSKEDKQLLEFLEFLADDKKTEVYKLRNPKSLTH